MAKKAVLCFVGKYQTYAQELTAPVIEWKAWKDLLTQKPFEFDSIVSLVDDGTLADTKKATRANVLAALEELLSGATDDDQLVFVYGGHGSIIKGNKNDQAQQTLIVYPDGNPDLQYAAVRESDVDAIFAKVKPPAGADITFVLDCCYAGSHDYGVLFGAPDADDKSAAIVLAARPLIDFRKLWTDVIPFGAFAEREDHYAKPVILAACRPDEKAREVNYYGTRRLLFTARFLGRLRQKPDKMQALIDAVNKLKPAYKQTAVVNGNKARAAAETFPGEGVTTAAITPEALVVEEGRATAENSVDVQHSINVRVLGIACFVDARGDSNPYQARVILPHDRGQIPEVGEADRHFACIEFATHEMAKRPTGDLPRECERVAGGVKYERWLLKGHTITIRTGDFRKTFVRSDAFHKHVPKLTVLAPELEPSGPRDECFDATPRLDRFAAFLDIPSGSVDIGPFHDEPTTFERVHDGSDDKVLTILTPRCVFVNIPIITEQAEIVLQPHGFPGKEDLVVTLKPGATFLLANAREIDISGDGGEATNDDVPREQFRLYYDVARFEPNPVVLPEVNSVPVDDCSVTDFP